MTEHRSPSRSAPAEATPTGRRRRPSGEPPPLPREILPSTRWCLLATVLAVAFTLALTVRPVLAAVTDVDHAVLRVFDDVRFTTLTTVLRELDEVLTTVPVPVIAWATIAVLLVYRRFRYLVVFLTLVLVGAYGAELASAMVGRMRPSAVTMLADWSGYSYPSRPVVALGLVLVGALYTLLPAGPLRSRLRTGAVAVLLLSAAARVYLGVDHPTDVVAALAIGWAMPIAGFRLITPEEAFPVTYRRGQRAHLALDGRRGEAIVRALDNQLGLTVAGIEPFGLAGSAGSTPLRLTVQRGDDATTPLFAKLYALNHLRSDRWYKLTRTVLYGRLEDEKPFSTVRRLAEYEDHMLRLFRDAGLPSPLPYGFVEITPEREYVVVMEFLDGAQEIGTAPVDTAVIDDALAVVRRLWDAGVAHRDLKPSNLLVRDGHVHVIDVAFAAVRPTPWRQAVDLANMMLTLALSSSPDLVYERALRQFDAEEIAEAFAATRSITVPTRLRARLREDGRDLVTSFRRLAPARPPIRIQVWSLRRVGLTLVVVVAAAAGAGVAVAFARLAGLL